MIDERPVAVRVELPMMLSDALEEKQKSSFTDNNDFGLIRAPTVTGSGVMIVHRSLEKSISGYQIDSLSPWAGAVPQLLQIRPLVACAITHAQPELGPWIAHRDSSLVATFHSYSLDKELLQAMTSIQRARHKCLISSTVRASLRRAKWITTVSNFTATLVRNHHKIGDRLVVIRNGVDSEHFAPASAKGNDHDQVRILFSGNPKRLKGSRHLQALAEEFSDNVIMQYTKGMRDSCVELPEPSKKLVAIPRCSHEQMPHVYNQADILFFPTIREGLSLAVLEAMACGLPVVATRCSSMPELIDHGQGGFLFEMNNRTEMANYLMQLVKDPGLRAEFGAYNREKILAQFTVNKMIDGYREVFLAC